jgi:hypothetical protein
MLAIQVRLDGATLANPHLCYALAYGQHLDTKLVPRNSRIAEERHLAQKAAEIGSANADAMYAHQGFARTGRWRLGNFDHAEAVRLFQLNGSHGVLRFNYFPADLPCGRDC